MTERSTQKLIVAEIIDQAGNNTGLTTAYTVYGGDTRQGAGLRAHGAGKVFNFEDDGTINGGTGPRRSDW